MLAKKTEAKVEPLLYAPDVDIALYSLEMFCSMLYYPVGLGVRKQTEAVYNTTTSLGLVNLFYRLFNELSPTNNF